MASDAKTKTSKFSVTHTRVAAISRFLRKAYGVTTTNSTRGIDGIRTSKGATKTTVGLTVRMLDDEKYATEWAAEIERDLTAAGYQVTMHPGAISMTITRKEWIIIDRIESMTITSDREALIDDAGLLAASDSVIEILQEKGFIQPGGRQLTELGAQARSILVDQRKKKVQADKRKLKARGW